MVLVVIIITYILSAETKHAALLSRDDNQTASFRRSGSCMADLIGREIVQPEQVSAAEGIDTDY